jgi:hypothetical protein
LIVGTFCLHKNFELHFSFNKGGHPFAMASPLSTV